MSKLKPCPFCGGEANVVPLIGNCACFGIECETGACPGSHINQTWHTLADAYDAWNRRAQSANEPLTLDELLEMDGEPVWCVDAKGSGKWALVHAADDVCTDAGFGDWEFYCYEWTDSDVGWLAYRRPPCEICRTEKRS